MEEEDRTNENETNNSMVEFDKLETEFRDAFVPDALSKLFDTDGSQSAAIKNDQEAHACQGLVTITDVHGLHVVAGIVYQTLTDFENWLYETEAGKDFQRVILQEFPDLKDPLEVGLRDLFRVLAPVLRQLQDKSHPHFQDIERWYSNYHLLVKAVVNFLHGGIARLRNRGSGQGNGSFDLSIIAIKILSIPQVENFIETLRAQCMTQSAAIQLGSLNPQISEVVRLAVEERIGGLLRFLQEVIKLKDPSNPIFREIESWFRDANVSVQIVLDFLHGAIWGFLNNGASEGFGALDLEGILREMQKARDAIETSWHNWFCRLIETESCRDLLKIISQEWLDPIRPNDDEYRETVTLFGAILIGIKKSPNISFQPIVS
nr:uncharacterized protein LOC129280054 [Lytechinus pictus]